MHEANKNNELLPVNNVPLKNFILLFGMFSRIIAQRFLFNLKSFSRTRAVYYSYIRCTIRINVTMPKHHQHYKTKQNCERDKKHEREFFAAVFIKLMTCHICSF